MFDWIQIAENGLWVGGLALVLAAFSWARWLAVQTRGRLRGMLTASLAGLWFDLGVTLIAVSLALSARSPMERAIWVAFALGFGVRVSRTAAARVSVAVWAPPLAERKQDVAGPLGIRLRAAAAVFERLEPAFLLAAAPFMLFPGWFTPWLIPLLVLPWLARGFVQRRLTGRSPLDGPVLILVTMLLVSLWVSTDRQQSIGKFYGAVYGIAVFHAFVNHVRKPKHALVASLGIALTGLVVSVLALAGTSWGVYDAQFPPTAWRGLPGVMARLGAPTAAGFNANEVAGTMSLFIPFVASLLLLGFGRAAPADERHSPADSIAHVRIVQGLLALTLMLMLANLVLADSRSARLGVAVALLVMSGLSRRRLWLTLPLGLLLCVLAWRGLGPAQILEPWHALSSVRNVQARLELWNRAIYMLQDFAFTGVGLNRFSATANTLYPLFTIAPEKALLLTHAHNMFLQVAVDLGIPGLVAYLALLLDSFAAWRTARTRLREGPLRAIGVGLLCSLVGYHVYGLGDCIALGAKPGLALWAMLGVTAALANMPLASNELVSMPFEDRGEAAVLERGATDYAENRHE